MEPKEKANELVNKFKNYLIDSDSHAALGIELDLAMIAVDEIISTIKIDYMRVQNRMQTVAYWQEVKRELELMQ